LRHHFDQLTSNGRRAKCPSNKPAECSGDGSDFCIMVSDDHAWCFRCNHRWSDQEKSDYKKPLEPIVPKTLMSSDIEKEANYKVARSNFLTYYDKIINNLKLPWNKKAFDDIYGLGALNNKDTVQLVFKITETHIKLHKGKQFGNAECKIYPMGVLPQLPQTSTLLICEGEKDAITAIVNGAPAITFTSGAGALPTNIDAIKPFTKLVICYDNDAVGREGAIKIAKALFKQNKARQIKILKWENKPEKYDLTDYFRDGNTSNDLYSMIDRLDVFGATPSDFGGLVEFNPEDFVAERNEEVIQICEEVLLEHGFSSIAGSSNVGKSILALQFAVCVAMGVPFLTFRVPKPRKVLFVQFEMLDAMVADRLAPLSNKLLADYPTCRQNYVDNLRLTSVANEKIFSDQYDKIEGNLMAADPPYDVVVVDNIYTSTSADTSKGTELTQLMSRIDELRDRYKCAWLLVSHHKKQEERRPLDHGMVYGSSYFVNFLDNLIQVANTGRHKKLKVLKITKIRTHNQFHDVPLGIYLQTEDEQLHFEYKKPLPKNEMYWYQDQEESEEDKILKSLETDGANFTYQDMANVLKEILNVSSSRTVTKWLDKLIKLGYVAKVERGHYVKLENELEQFLK